MGKIVGITYQKPKEKPKDNPKDSSKDNSKPDEGEKK